ncbi:MAG: undecaprenyl/decaprenyl-phosphate alpha-N-acetylglucosaminyl 1-phosphate transferase [Anaerolineae bacterium]|nr:undecaprenyl/decaprenyl-phosphate alpha-N-acetylglucosaminyl 1-phosphate transferase [Anaerolineae bacterium]NUQ06255.1 undecaprenyl/decaprenyl-phosphate alpha-N-acetylglucosaminyl 1-phosphate transferase [Anaerolineae bacterium]
MDPLLFVPVMVVGFATALGMTPLSRAIALRLGVVDKPNQRKLHTDHKPLMGGLAIFAGFTLAILLFVLPHHLLELGALLLGAALLAVVGLIDDRYDLGIRVKLVAQAVAAGILILGGIHIQLFNTPLLDYPLTVLWVVTLTNAVNFLDNMDGLSAGLSAIAGLYFTFLAYNEGVALVGVLAAALAGSAIGFLIYNFNPASTFMGDMGALVLGFVLSALGIELRFGAQPLSVTWMVPILVLALPLFDICLVVFTRLSEGRSPGQAGKDHTSHRLLSLGLSQRRAIFVLYGGCAVFGALGVLVSREPPERALWIGFGALALLGGLFLLMMFIRRRYQLNKPAPPPTPSAAG